VTDDPRRGGPPAGDQPAGPEPDATPLPSTADDEALAALERLQSLGGAPEGAVSAGPKAPSRKREAAPAPSGRASSGRRPAGARPRAAAAGSPSRTAVRIAAPVLFLVAVIVLISLLFQSGVVGGPDETRAPAPTPKATKTKKATAKPTSTPASPSGTKVYVVKSGDTLTGIAVKFDTTVSELQALNPDVSSTLVVGSKLRVPTAAP
jgi:LysM repeat protein